MRKPWLFGLSQQHAAQSEPERTHFAIRGGVAELGERERSFLAESVKWSVLFEEEETKIKSPSEPEGAEYILNPIYAPYFHISYRKRRKLDLTAEQASTLISGSYEEVKGVLNFYRRKWNIDIAASSASLFGHLEEEDD